VKEREREEKKGESLRYWRVTMPSNSGDDNVLQVLIKNFDVLAL